MQNKLLNKHVILTGHYGSGKTNIAVSMAYALRAAGKRVALCDVDIVNPYFRAADAVEPMRAAGIEVIVPETANTNLDTPLIPGAIQAAFTNRFDHVIFDVGGDDAGAIVLGTYHEKISGDGDTMLYVVNPYRPLTETPEQAEEVMREIEASSHLKVSGIINNANLGEQTVWSDVEAAAPYFDALESRTGLPVFFTTVMIPLEPGAQRPDHIFTISRHTKTYF